MTRLTPKQFSSTLCHFGPSKFRRATEKMFDIERGDTNTEDIARAWGVTKDEVSCSDRQFTCLRYGRTVHGEYYGICNELSYFLIRHHIPSLTSDMEYLRLMTTDLRHLSKLDAYRALLNPPKPNRQDYAQYYYITNKDFWPHWKHNEDGWQEARQLALQAAGIEIDILCIDPYSMGRTVETYPEFQSTILQMSREPDGLAIHFSPNGVCVSPFGTSDAIPAENPNTFYSFNLDTLPLAREHTSALLGLQDILHLKPAERHISSFLIAHPELLLGDQYVQLRTEITIAATGERPDFFLERADGLWDILELKRPVSASFLVDQPDGIIQLSGYLAASLRQCDKYLRLLDTERVRHRLREKFGITIEYPTITLLIGTEQYPNTVVTQTKSIFNPRIQVRSFTELFQECSVRAARELRELQMLNENSQ